MRRYHKKQCIELLEAIEEAHAEIIELIAKGQVSQALLLMEDCQQGAIRVGTTIDELEGEGTQAVSLLEEYCGLIYKLYEDQTTARAINIRRMEKKLHKLIGRIKGEIREGLSTQYEVVFLPYLASMWDSLESVWKAADKAEDTTAYVIPIPYYDKEPDGTYKALKYEGSEFPKDVPIVSYKDYDFEGRHPDRVYIHNGYDDINIVTEVAAPFHSPKLKQYTDELIYIPYFVLAEPGEDEEAQKAYAEDVKHFVLIPGIFNADRVIVQSEAMKQVYVRILTEYAGRQTKSLWEKKIEGTGSPKFERLLSMKKEDMHIPPEWEAIIKKPDGSSKKIILYNTSVSALLSGSEKMLDKMQRVFSVFKESSDEVALLWRPHPLIESTIRSMRPELWQAYSRLVLEYRMQGWGIYDDTSDVDRAMIISDAYYGDNSSLVWLCQKIGKPVMIQSVEV